MGPSTPFIRRPVATTLLTFGLAAAGAVAFFKLPVSPLPQVDFPTISVQATLPGASPQDVATTVASPLERHLGQIADVTEMTSSSTVGSARITLQFGLNRDINGAARDVQAAINAARADLPTSLRTNPTYRKVNPADAPILVLTLTSDTATRGEVYDAASTVLAQKLSQVEGVGEVAVSGSSLPAVRVDLMPQALYKYGIGLEDVRAALSSANAHSPKGGIDVGDRRYQIYANDQANKADDYKSLIVAYRNGAAVHITDVGEVTDGVENLRNAGLANGKPAVLIILYRQPGANIISTVDAVKARLTDFMTPPPAPVRRFTSSRARSSPSGRARSSSSSEPAPITPTVILDGDGISGWRPVHCNAEFGGLVCTRGARFPTRRVGTSGLLPSMSLRGLLARRNRRSRWYEGQRFASGRSTLPAGP